MMKPTHHGSRLIVIGAGITGLSTALAWKRSFPDAGHSVIVLEKNNIPGGCVTTFAREGYRFDTTQIIPDVSDLLEYFGVDIPLHRFDHHYARLFLADTASRSTTMIPVPSSHLAFEQSLVQRYPDEADNIAAFFSYCRQMHKELNFLKTEPRWHQLPSILYHCRKILANSNKTYAAFLDRFRFRNEEIREVLDIFSSFSGLSADRCAALLTACAMITTLNGSYRPGKGFIQFPLALKKRLLDLGGELKTQCEVTQILTSSGKVRGVALSDGQVLEADYVVSTVDTKWCYDVLLRDEHDTWQNHAYFEKLRNVRMSPSGFAIQLGLDEGVDLAKYGLDCGYCVLTTGRHAHARMFDAWEKDTLLRSETCFHMGIVSPSTITGGKPNLIIHVVPVPSAYWIQLRQQDYQRYLREKREVADFYIRKADEYLIPGLSSHIRLVDISTPATYKRYIGSPGGSQYDMMPVPSNFGKNRLPSRTPIEGLFIPKFSHGIWPAMQGGLQVVDMITGGKVMGGNASLSHA